MSNCKVIALAYQKGSAGKTHSDQSGRKYVGVVQELPIRVRNYTLTLTDNIDVLSEYSFASYHK